MSDVTVRRARRDDHEAVAAFTRDTWPDRDIGGWIPEVFPEWVETDGADQRTVVADVEGEVAGLCQATLLSAYEAWTQGLRVHPDYRGRGLGLQMADHLLSWCRERGATIVRNMVFSWNAAGLGTSRAAGFEPGVEFRWAHPEPDPDAGTVPAVADLEVVTDPDAAWTYWQRSAARDELGGLALDLDESWALTSLTRERLARAAERERVLAVQGDGTRALAFRVRDTERELEDGATERLAEYGVAAWADQSAAEALFAAVARDAAAIGADRTRVLIPETPRHVSDAVAAGAGISDTPDFVLEADLTTRT